MMTQNEANIVSLSLFSFLSSFPTTCHNDQISPPILDKKETKEGKGCFPWTFLWLWSIPLPFSHSNSLVLLVEFFSPLVSAQLH